MPASYVVSLRRREVGLRVALGSLRSTIVTHYLARAMEVVCVANTVGLVLSLAMSRTLSSMLYGVSPFDPLTLLGVIGIVLLVATLAAFLPSFRASRIDPASALQEQ
jgi:ABC-type antimicrobial peptide transport system permease subunit